MALEINIGEEYKIKIEKEKEFADSIFIDIYTQAAKNIDKIIYQASLINKENQSTVNNDYNNVIAFTGERGTGKSSSMISLADALKNKSIDDTFWDNTKNLKNSKIVSIDTIDPSLFRNDDKLFEIIISKMFSKFQLKLKKKENRINDGNKRSLIKKFQEVFNNLKVVHNGKSDVYDKEAIEALSDLAFGTNLKSNFKELVDEFLSCIYNIDNSNDKGFLLITIDDFDLNISGAYEMLEDIRQFLIQSNVIILIAFKMQQLQDSINNEIIKEYEMIFKHGEKAKVYLSENISNKSNKYLDKLFPLERRFNTPRLIENNISSKKMNLYDADYELKNKSINGTKIYFIKNQTIEDTFLGLVYRKTDLLIPKNRFEKNVIIPNTLRDLANTITLIYRNSDINSFKTYLNKEITSNLIENEVSFFNELDETSNATLNQFILNWIGENKGDILPNEKRIEVIESRTRKGRLERVEFESETSILTKIKRYYNSSFGDVLSVFRELKTNVLVTDIKNLQFISYLNIYYSIRYTEFFKEDNNFENLQILTNDRLTNHSIKYLPTIRDRPSGFDRRDYFEITKKPLEIHDYIKNSLKKDKLQKSYTIEMYFWVIHFFNFIGKGSLQNKNYINITDDIKNRSGNKYETVTFNAISFLSNINNSEKIIGQYANSNLVEEIVDSKLYKELKKWNITLSKNYYLIYNINLFDEILNKLYDYASNKDSLGDNYGKRLHTYLYDGLNDICSRLSEKYTIDLSEITNNPFLNYWNNNEMMLNEILHLLFDSSSNNNFEYNYILDKENFNLINRFISNSLPSLTKMKLSIFINKLTNSNNPPNQNIIDSLWKIRQNINLNNIQNKKIELRDLLNKLKSNG
ncbi:hypothetical protein QSV08_04890 [Maribacter sp. BPC-D8]|uniref:hypothetical protein n=1 Tax=Maribacter sp. BPC-D8 TaxID=3053613 RepID=UPI002B4631E4|nr:hypothetical protein [Maribacter sp. BPC-D8]WRI30578.1 hypothetical protein QSV08_04890 [Maribacter sp. BPC-D8]